MMTPHTSLAQVLSLFIVIHGHTHGAFSLTRPLPSSFTFSSCPSPSSSSIPSCSLSSTTRSSWQVCATPPQKRVRTPWTPSPLTQIDHQAKLHDSQFMDKSYGHGDLQERRPDESRKLQTNLLPPSALETFLHCELDQYQFPDQAGFRNKFCTTDQHTYCTRKQRVENWHLSGGDRLPEGVRLNSTWCNLEISQKPFYQWAIHLSFEEVVCWPIRRRADGRGEWWIQGRSWNRVAFWSVFFSTRFFNQQRRKTLRFGTRRAWASNWVTKRETVYPTCGWRSARDGDFFDAAQRNDCGLGKKYRSARARNSPRQNKNSHHSENEQSKIIEIDRMHVEILPPEGKVKYLEKMITVMDQGSTEVQHRIRCAWSAFARHRQELTSKSYLLRHCLHLFDAVVIPTVMCGTWTWTTTKEHEKLRTSQRRMLHLIIQTKRKYKKKNKED